MLRYLPRHDASPPEPCACGHLSAHRTHSAPPDVMMIIRGVNVFPGQIESVSRVSTGLPPLPDSYRRTIRAFIRSRSQATRKCTKIQSALSATTRQNRRRQTRQTVGTASKQPLWGRNSRTTASRNASSIIAKRTDRMRSSSPLTSTVVFRQNDGFPTWNLVARRGSRYLP